MLAKAPDRISLPEQRRDFNPRRPETRDRCAARLRVITDKRLSMGARCAYALLDDYAGMKATCWPKQKTIAYRLGASRQKVQRWIAELAACGWLRIERTGRASRYALDWASDRRPCEHRLLIPEPVCMEQAPEVPAAAEEPVDPPPCRCQGRGWILYTSHRIGGKSTQPRLCGCRQDMTLAKAFREARRSSQNRRT